MTFISSAITADFSMLVDDYYQAYSTNLLLLDVLDNDILAANSSLTDVSPVMLDGQPVDVMATIVGNQIEFDTADLAEGEYTFTYTVAEYPTVPSGVNLLVNASFEQGHYCFDWYGQAITYNLQGWDVTGQAQVNTDNAYYDLYKNHSSSDGVNYLELDAGSHVDGVSQTVSNLQAGDSYQFTFDMMGEPGFATADQVMEVVWNGEVVATLSADQAGWESQLVDLVAIDGDNVLTLRESSGSNDCQGIFIDNLSLEALVQASSYEIVSEENLVQNGSFEMGCFYFNCYGQAIGTNLYGWDVQGQYQVNRGTRTDSDGASDGYNYAELDANSAQDGLSQTIENLENGDTYRLSIDLQSRDRASDAETLEIYWNGELVETINVANTDWETYTIDVVATDGDNVLSLREPSDENNRFGVLMDNIQLNHVETVTVEPVTTTASVTVVVDRAEAVNDVLQTNAFNNTPTTPVIYDVLANDDDPLGNGLSLVNVSTTSEMIQISIVQDADGNDVISVLPDPDEYLMLVDGQQSAHLITYTAVDADGNAYTGRSVVVLNGSIDPDSSQLEINLIVGTEDSDPFDDIPNTSPDNLVGTDASDVIAGLGGDDNLSGGDANDYLLGDEGNDILNGDAGDDELSGGDGNDILNGGNGNDLVDGDEGDDIIQGGTGNDNLYGGAGADIFLFSSGDGADIINDFEDGFDQIDLTSFGLGAEDQLQITDNLDGSVTGEIGDVSFLISGDGNSNVAGLIGMDDFIFAA